MERQALARAYYRHIDDGAYDDLAELLCPEFVHERPDRTLEGRDRFVRFMREERPDPDTTHEVGTVYEGDARVAVEGRLLRAAGSELFGFVDTFAFERGHIGSIRTYTR